jgi:hypothetical protein
MTASMAREFRYPGKPRPGDAVAVLSPSSGLAARFPRPYELGLRRLREEFGLRPVEFPTTRAAAASPADRATDVVAAWLPDDAYSGIVSSKLRPATCGWAVSKRVDNRHYVRINTSVLWIHLWIAEKAD